MELILERTYRGADCTTGVLHDKEGRFICYTLEEPWKDNKNQISCIPVGTYDCVNWNGFKFKDVWNVSKVPNRVAILIHSGNTTNDIEGCILVGLAKSEIKGLKAVLESKKALQKLKDLIGRDAKGELNSFKLVIKNG
jgi:hypothetical protein